MNKHILNFLVAVFLSGNLFCQEAQDWGTQILSSEFKSKNVVPPTPEAAALGKYGNIPVSLFTGTPSISIPLYQISGNNISLPVQLSYHAGGFNPQEIANWVGLGWALNAGGVVTRSVMGNPDVNYNYFDHPTTAIATPSQLGDPFFFYDYMKDLKDNVLEAQPDVYYFNFAGYSGKFFIKPDNSIIQKEKSNFQISVVNAGGYSGISNITIKDDKGITYIFSTTEVSDMVLDDFGATGNLTFNYFSSWYLTQIISADETEVIDLTYHTTENKHTQFVNYLQNDADVYEATTSLTGPGSTSFSLTSQGGSVPPIVKTQRKYLDKISLKRGGTELSYIEFTSTEDQRQDLSHNITNGFPGERLLTNVKAFVKNTPASFALNKEFDFNYSYFTNSSESSWEYKRLRLDNVQEKPVKEGTPTPPPYVFTYNNDNAMPSLYTVNLDHWGFYNKGISTSRLVPAVNINNNVLTINDGNRAPTLAGSSNSLLNKITYPLGGYTTFEYELNKAGNITIDEGDGIVTEMDQFNVGGVRLKKMTDYSFEAKKAVEKTYKYELDDGFSSGRAVQPLYRNSTAFTTYGQPPGGGGPGDFGNGTDNCNAEETSIKYTETVSATSVFGLGTVQGSHIGYSTVTELSTDPANGQSLGKTVYKYYCHQGSWDIHNDDPGNGDLLKMFVYNNAGKLLEETSNTYNYVARGFVGAVAPGVIGAQDNKTSLVKLNASGGTYSYGWYITSACVSGVVDAKIIKTRYANGGWSVSSTEKQLSEVSTKKYDQKTDSYIGITKKLTYGNSAHTLPTSIEQTTSNGEVVITDKKYPLDYLIPSITNIPDERTRAIKQLKDKNIVGAEIETIQSRQKADGTNKRYINGLITSYNEAIPYPSGIYRLEIKSPLTTFVSSSVNSSGIFEYNSNYKPAGSIIYQNVGSLMEQSKQDDVPTAYIWDYNSRYPTAEVINGNTGQIAYTSFETNENGGWTSIDNINTNRNEEGGITGKFSYNLVFGSSITKTNLQTNRQFIVSYWSKDGAVNITPAGTISTGPTHNQWKYYENLLPVNTNSVTISLPSTSSIRIDELRLFPKNAMMSTVAYDPGVGIISQCSPKNQLSYFEYDGLNRLVNVRDDDKNIIKNYQYNFGTDLSALAPSTQSLFYNEEKNYTGTKQDCQDNDAEGSSVTYTVPYGKYVALNQTDADAKASQDLTDNKQTYINAHGKCLYWNDAITDYFSRNNCGSLGVSECDNNDPAHRFLLPYTVEAHRFYSEESKIAANTQASTYLQQAGQTAANESCGCSCDKPWQMMIENACRTGTRINDASDYDEQTHMYTCTYHYVFVVSGTTYVSDNYTETSSTGCPVH